MSLSLEDKIEIRKEGIRGVPVVQLEEAILREKCGLFAEIVGGEAFTETDKKGLTLDNKYTELREKAKDTNPEAVEKIDEWDLSEEQKDYLFVQRIMTKVSEGRISEITAEDSERLDEIKDKVKYKREGETQIRIETRRILASSRMTMILAGLNKKYPQTENQIANNQREGEEK